MDASFLTGLSRSMILYFRGDQKRVHHALKVHSFASLLGRLEGFDARLQIVLETAALLHDIGIPRAEEKYGSSAGPYQEKEGPAVAAELLAGFPLEQADLERVLFLIGHHHSYGAVDGPDFQVLIEADFLVNMFEDEMSLEQIEAVERNIFKTDSGRELLKSLYSSL